MEFDFSSVMGGQEGDGIMAAMAADATASHLSVDIPPTLPLDALVRVLASDGQSSSAPVTEQRLRQPDASLIVHIYQTLLSIPELQEKIALSLQRSEEQDRRIIEMETQLHDAERLQAEADTRAEQDRIAKEQALAEKEQLASELAQARGTLTALQSSTETGTQKSAEVKGRLEQIEQEKRGLLELVERERIESSRRAEEIDALTTRGRESRAEILRLSSELQEAKSNEATTRFRMQNLEQELALKSNDATWAHTELNKTTDELAALRVKVHADHAALTSRTQQAVQELEAAQSKVSSLQGAYDSTLARLEETTREKAELRQRLVEQESAFKTEMTTQQRLNDLVEQQKDNAEKRLKDVEEQWERILGEFREREEALREEVAKEQSLHRELAEEKDALQFALDRLAAGVGVETANGHGHGSVDGDASAPSIADGMSMQSRASFGNFTSAAIMSPTAALASRVQKSGMSFTQVYAELAKTQEELRREKLESQRLGNVLEQVMTDLQERAPALQAQREETERLGRELEEISVTLAQACEDRDVAERDAKRMSLESEASKRENDLLNRQLGDLAQQVRDLTREIILHDSPAAAADMTPDGSHVGNSTSATIADVTSTQSIISTELVTFRSLTELVTQNERLLRVVRELGAKMEAEEGRYRADIDEQESEAVEEAKLVITRLQEEIRAERTRTDSIRRERDMFRNMTSQGRHLPPATSSTSSQESSAAHIALTTQYNQLQGQFEALRTETSNDMERLKEEAHQARSEASRSALAAAREKATRESLEERLANAQRTHNFERSELQELQKRHSSVQEALTKQEVAAQSLTQQLVTAQNNVERMRNEVSNLSAERLLHKETAERLMSEKESAVKERSSLSDLLRSSQSMQAELERSGSEIRRRLESQLEKIEEQSKELRERLTKEEDSHRNTAMRRDVETTDLRARLERSAEELSKAREELAVAKNSSSHLVMRTEELQRQVDAKDEKLSVYERRTLSSASNTDGSQTQLSAEQQLQVELAELRGELRNAQVEVEQSKGHIEQYQSIASANEEALAQLQTTYDEYKRTTDASLAQKESDITSLRERTTMLAAELTNAQTEASTERQERQNQLASLTAEKKTLEDALSEVTQVEDRARLMQEGVQEEIRRSVQAAQEAHSRYEAELMAHAEDVKALTSHKEQISLLRTQVLEAQKASETAQGNLANSQDSWSVQRSLLEREKDEQKRIVSELRAQNEALHNHLEVLQAQVQEIRQAAAGGADVGDASFASQSGSDELQEVIKYLRREKEIVDLQVELREQECARLRQSVERMQRSLDEVRMQLSQEREHNMGAAASEKQHEELMEKINQLSILRESNTTLRDELERSQRRVQSLEIRLDSLTKEIDPLREEIRVKTVELEACQNQLRLTQEDNKRWQGRTQSILQQYNRIDPDELKNLQEQKQNLESSLEEQKALHEEKEKELETAKAEVQTKQDQFTRLRQQTIDRIRTLNQTIAELQAENTRIKAEQAQQQVSLNSESDSNEAALASLRSELDTLKADKQQLEEKVSHLDTERAQLISQAENAAQNALNGGNESSGNVDESVRQALSEAQEKWNIEKQELEQKHQAVKEREQMHLQKAKEFNTARRTAELERDEARKAKDEETNRLKEEWTNNHASEIEKVVNERLASGAAKTEESVDSSALQAKIVQLEQELEQTNTRIRELEEAGAGDAAGAVSGTQEEREAALREQEERLSKQYMEQQRKAVEIAVSKARSAGANNDEQVQQRVSQAIAEKEAELKAHYEEQLKAKYESGKEEATLRNKLLIKTKDTKIEKLTAELNQLKGIAPTGATVQQGAQATPTPGAPSVRGGMAARPVPRPIAPAAGQQQPARGGASMRGTAGRGGAPNIVTAQKRKIEQRQSSGGIDEGEAGVDAGTDAQNGEVGAEGGANLPKKPRPAGGPITIRGGAGGQRGGASNRGGRGGGAAGSS